MGDQQRESWAGRNSPLLVIEFSREKCPFSNRDHTWQQFHTFRNEVLDILSSYGSIGPSGKLPILDTYEESLDARGGAADLWQVGNSKPDFFVVDDDMYGMSVRVEAAYTLAKPPLLEELAMLLKAKQFREWSVYLALIKGGLFVFHDRIFFEGGLFAGCTSVENLYHRCALGADTDAPSRERKRGEFPSAKYVLHRRICSMKTLNEPFSKLSMRRRYEAWFLRLGLADGSGAWWFRYLLMNPRRDGCGNDSRQQPVQVWATWFPRSGKPQTWIQGFPLRELQLSARGASPFLFEAGENRISENECRGRLEVDGHRVCWDLRYRSTFHVELSSKGWIGFSRTPQSDATFSGEIRLDEQTFHGEPLGYGMQGHNCGYRHRKFWTWAHIHFRRSGGSSSTVEALVYEMPLGLIFRRVAICHEGREYVFDDLRDLKRDPHELLWSFCSSNHKFLAAEVEIQGRKGLIHRLPYFKTDCSGQFEVANDSLATAKMTLWLSGGDKEELFTDSGAVVEMAGSYK